MKKRDFSDEIEEFEQTPLEDLLAGSEPVKAEPAPGGVKVVLSIRLDRATVEALDIYAEEIDQKTTVVARELIREGLIRGGLRLPAYVLSEMLNERLQEGIEARLEERQEGVIIGISFARSGSEATEFDGYVVSKLDSEGRSNSRSVGVAQAV